MVEQPVEDCRCCKLSGKQFIPSAHWQVGGDDEGAFFISLADDLKKQALSFSCGMSSKIDPLFRLNLTHPNVFRVWVSFFIISDFYTVF